MLVACAEFQAESRSWLDCAQAQKSSLDPMGPAEELCDRYLSLGERSLATLFIT
jgi:hypothetical protein